MPPKKPERPPEPEAPGGPHDRQAADLERLRVEAHEARLDTYDPLETHRPHDPGKSREILQGGFEDIEKFFTEFGHNFADIFLLQDSRKMGEYEKFLKEYWHGIEEYAKALKQGKEEWQKEAAEIIDGILKLADNAAELYESYPDYPFGENFATQITEQNIDAANKREHRQRLFNQAIALYYLKMLQDLDKLNITRHPDFKEVQHLIDNLKSKMSEIEDLNKFIKECRRQSALATYRRNQSIDRNQKKAEDGEQIQNFDSAIGRAPEPKRLRALGKVVNYKTQAGAHVRELEEFLADGRKHHQDTLATIDARRGQARKRMDAHNASRALSNTINGLIGPAINAHAVANGETINANTRVTDLDRLIVGRPIRTRYQDIAGRRKAALLTAVALPLTYRAADLGHVTHLTVEVRNARHRATAAENSALVAEGHVRDALKRAKDALTRSKIIQSYKNDTNIPQELRDTLNYEAAKEVEKYANQIAQMHKQVTEIDNLIKINALKIQDSFSDIENIFREMDNEWRKNQDVINNANMVFHDAGFERERQQAAERAFDTNLQRLVKQIVKAEEAKNNALAVEESLWIEKQDLLWRISNTLPEEMHAVDREENNEAIIANLARNDIRRLDNLERCQVELEEALDGGGGRMGLIQYARDHAQILDLIRWAIETNERDLENVIFPDIAEPLHLQTFERHCREGFTDLAGTAHDGIEQAEEHLRRVLENVEDAEREATKVFMYNELHMGQQIPSDAKRIIENIQKTKDKIIAEYSKKQSERGKAPLIIDPKKGKFTVGNNGVWEPIQKIGGFAQPDYTRKSTGETTLDLRPEVIDLQTIMVTREAKVFEKEAIYVKTFSERFFESDKCSYTLKIPGNTLEGGSRRRAELKIVHRSKIGTANPAGGHYTEADCTEYQYLDMEGLTRMRIIENHNQNGVAEILFRGDTDITPNPVVDHAIAAARREGPGWTEQDMAQMWELDLNKRVIRFPNGIEISIDEIDWTETTYDQENGLVLQFKGPKKLSQICLYMLGTMDTFNQKYKHEIKALKEKKREHVEKTIEWLKAAVKSYDIHEINNAFTSLQAAEGREAYLSDLAKDELVSPPLTKEQLRDLRKKKKEEKKNGTPYWATAFTESTAKMRRGRRDYESKIKELTQDIHQKNPLSAEYLRTCYVYPGVYRIDKHSSSKKKQELLDEIYKANNLHETIAFDLLEDPKHNLPGAVLRPISRVKNASPNALQLLREYNKLKNETNFATPAERQNVEAYVASIAMQFRTNKKIHPYYTNQWYLEQAIEAANEGNLSGKHVGGKHIKGADYYIGKLKQVDCPLNPTSIAELRQADEYHWVTYLKDASGKMEAERIPQVLDEALKVAQLMQGSRFDNLELAAKALDPMTPSDEAKKILGKIIIEDRILPPPPKPATKTKGDTTKDSLDFKYLTKKSDLELTQDAGKITEEINRQVNKTLQELIDSTDDIGIKNKYRESALELYKELTKTNTEFYKRREDMAFHLRKFELYTREMSKRWWMDFFKDLAFLWIKNLTNFASKDVQTFLGELLKIAMANINK